MTGTYVGGIAGNIAQSILSSDSDELLLELGGGDLRNGVGRVRGRLKRQEVGKKTSNVGRGHRGTRDLVGGVLAANPGGQNVEAGGEDVVALAVVGEVGTLISESRGTDSDGLLGTSRRVPAGVGVVVTGSNSEVDTSIDSSVDSEVESGRLATAQTHVGSGALEALLALAGLGSGNLGSVLLSSVLDTLDDVGHGAGAVGAEDLDGVDVGLLGNTVLLTGDGARAVGAVAVSILVGIALRNGLAPVSATLEVDVLGVGAGVDNVDIDALSTIGSVQVFAEGTEAQALTVRDTGETPGGVLLDLVVVILHGVDLGVLLDVLDLGTKLVSMA